ncbi:MAG: holin [Clostridiales bacterium]|nr:holin [Hornefia butyriciproducens]MCI7679105.1 holin [Clostridiales bacterium]MDY5463918.1 holin [Hornefia butyriciproducens]
MMINKIWMKAAGVRAVKTMAQTAIATIGSAAVLSSVDWRMVISAAVLAGILSLLTSVAGLPEATGPSELTAEEAEGGDEDVTEEETEEEAK